MQPNATLYQHNDLVRAPLKLSHAEARLFAFALSCLHQKRDSLDIEVAIADAATSPGGTAYELVRHAADTLASRTIKTENTDPKSPRRFEAIPIFKRIRVDEETGLVTGSFNEDLRPFLVNLTSHFTKVELLTILTLKSAHAHKLYWVLKSYMSLAHKEFEYEALRELLLGTGSESYTLWTDFKRHVLEPARKEIRDTGWMIEYQETKVGKKVGRVNFILPAMPGAEKPALEGEKKPQKALVADTEWQTKVINRLTKMQVTQAQIRHILSVVGADENDLKKILSITHPLLTAHESGFKHQDNLGGATVNKLKSEFPKLFHHNL